MEKVRLAYKSYSINVYHKPGQTDEKIVFLHGGGLDNAMLSWKEVIGLMGDKYDIYAIDMIGYGESDKPDIVYSIPMYIDFLYDILLQLNIEKTHLAGLSLGGGVSLGFSLKYPQMVDKLVLTGSMGFCDKMPCHTISRWYVNSSLNPKSYGWFAKSRRLLIWDIASALIGDKEKITDELVNKLNELLHEPEIYKPFVSLQRYEMGKKKITTDLVSHLGELKMPVLIVNGEKDPGVSLKSAEAASKIIPNSRLYIMKGCKHWAQKERPEEFVKALMAFI